VLDLGTGSRLLGEELVGRYFPGAGLSAGAPETPETPGERDVAEVRLELAVFVTHLHFDHVQGLPFFGPALQGGCALDLYGPAQDSGSLADALHGLVQPPYFPVGLADLPASLRLHGLDDGASVAVGDAVVRARTVPHGDRTFGYRIECDDQVIAYLGDHQAPRPGHRGARVAEEALQLARGADVLIHDAQYTAEEFGVKGHWGHSTVEFALEMAHAAQVRKLVLFHHDPTHDDEMLDQIGSDAQRLAARAGLDAEVVVAAEGLSIKLDT
jgi:phosphoribosyl 1,2-cyclic phosphodiesterase